MISRTRKSGTWSCWWEPEAQPRRNQSSEAGVPVAEVTPCEHGCAEREALGVQKDRKLLDIQNWYLEGQKQFGPKLR